MSHFFSFFNSFDLSAIRDLPLQTFWFIITFLIFFTLCFIYKSYKNIIQARIIEDTPTAKIRSAAQGYVELQGTQHFYKDRAIIAPLTKLPCTWYYFTIEHYANKNHWRKINEGRSSHLFELRDPTGTCIVDPTNAQITTSIKDSWGGFSEMPNGKPKTWIGKLFGLLGNYRYHEWRMEQGMPIYAIGNFLTVPLKTVVPTSDSHTEVNIITGKGLIDRNPFLLSAYDQTKLIAQHRKDAMIWFFAYMILLIGCSWLFIVRFS